ncbi:Mrl1p NDAI_0A08010 [Naumovozyma dairenensis CBS 421]|uniref:MRH domain-containing protein n=1 Tax=Naumovozyma dairenensis (strain ATCC 10597 / BCRC 20456 / CBS 421 / NBRC 0211 / NRRL Y-12639) TaxID=1071378 RepID=G0W567_NAUDC|nr:hypothetical protein NDAI_0A08010 [Naumovozyma dairenensis CBS 421]CCD22955.1 hypothetical protein NDAI_0A08010 [Naumovozyma dairenensis CBS 421]
MFLNNISSQKLLNTILLLSIFQIGLIACSPSNKNKNDGNSISPPSTNPEKPDLFCAVMNPSTGSYIDLSHLSSTPNKSRDNTKVHKNSNVKSRKDKTDTSKTRWLVRGWDYDTNFTLSICSSPVTKTEEDQLSNLTGGYYIDQKDSSKLISIGNFATEPKIMGPPNNKKLTLKYENGSMCPNGRDKKATLLNFVCDRDISTKAQISYIGSLADCSYFFEVRSIYACPTSNKENEVNVVGIFFGIFFVFFLVELGRRWLNKKTTRGNNTSYSRYQDLGSSDNQIDSTVNLYPRWAQGGSNISPWMKPFVGVKNLIVRIASRGTRDRHLSNIPGTTFSRYPIRLRSTSDISNGTSFFRDMEAQNDMLDSIAIPDGLSNSNSNSNSETASALNSHT